MIAAIVIGGLAGWIASMITKNDHQMGIFLNIIAGIIGGAIGSAILRWLGYAKDGGWIYHLLVGVLGAVILLSIINFFTRKR